jgi:protein-L-isoaspartate O-methyltransferase
MTWPRILIATLLPLVAATGAHPSGETSLEESAPSLEALREQFAKAETAGDYETALDLARKMEEHTFEKHVEVLYDTARMYARSGDASSAYRYLYRATDSGFWDIRRMREDPAFEAIREDELFRDLSRKAWSNGYLWMLERDQREEYQKKDEILAALELKPGMFVADVGAGSGYFTVPLAQAVGDDGTVLATDIRQQMLDHIARRVRIEKLDNVELLLAEPGDPMLPKAKADLILMVDVYHYIQERTAFGEKLLEALAPGGRLVIIDFIPKPWEERPWGPPPQQHLSEETLTADLAEAGFRVLAKHDFLEEQFFVVYGREER